MVAKTSPDQVVVNGIVGDGAVVSFQVRGGMARGTDFLFEIHGTEGDLVLTATSRTSMQRQELKLKARAARAPALADLPVPGKYRWVPEGLTADSRYNVAQLYAKLGERIRDGKPASPGFDAAVTRHRLLDAIVRASETGQKQHLDGNGVTVFHLLRHGEPTVFGRINGRLPGVGLSPRAAPKSPPSPRVSPRKDRGALCEPAAAHPGNRGNPLRAARSTGGLPRGCDRARFRRVDRIDGRRDPQRPALAAVEQLSQHRRHSGRRELAASPGSGRRRALRPAAASIRTATW